ncbi:MAG: EF-hand domain-containing protein [Gemmataceae bacterium]
MRMTRMQVGLLALVLVAVLIPAAYTQFGGRGGPGGGKGGFGKGGFGKGGFNPDDIFNMLSKGSPTFDVNTVELRQFGQETVEQQREKMNSYLQTKGVSNGSMTKELYKEYMEGRMRDMTKDRANKGFDSLANGAASFNVDTVEIPNNMLWGRSAESQREAWKKFLAGKGVNTGAMTRELYAEYSESRMREFREKGDTRTEEEKKRDMDSRTRDSFKQMDTNGDGFVTMEEAQAARQKRMFGDSISEKENFDRFDANKDGKISFEEFQKYIEVRTEEREKRREEEKKEQGKEEAAKGDDLEARPPVYRYGKLPKELPPWFNDLDTDKDAQIGLYEWKQQGRDVKEFLAMDTNGDGFVTPEEQIRFEKAKAKGVDLKTATAASGPVRGPERMGQGGGGGDRGGDRGGKGGRRGWGDGGDGKGGKGDRGGKGGRRGWGDGGDGKGGKGGMDPEKMKEFFNKRGKGGRGGDRPE